MDRAAEAARWLAEAWETGNPLAPLPPEIAPRDAAEGEAIAFALLEALGLAPCGVRVAPGPGGVPVAAPMFESRLLKSPAAIALPALRHPRASAALVGVLAEALGEEGEPRFAALHPALDIASSRFTAGASDAASSLADLGDLGFVVAGRAAPAGRPPTAVALGPPGARGRGTPLDPAAVFAHAVAAARRLGGLPAGALLVVAGLAGPVVPSAGMRLAARFGRAGRAEASFTAG
jgi:2-keto-4-pentenoate hydratase